METIEITSPTSGEAVALEQARQRYKLLQEQFTEIRRSAKQCRQMAEGCELESREANDRWKSQLNASPGQRPSKEVNADIERSMKMSSLAEQYRIALEELGRKIEYHQIPLAQARMDLEKLQREEFKQDAESDLAKASDELKDCQVFQKWFAAMEKVLSIKVPRHMADYAEAIREFPGSAGYQLAQQKVKQDLANELMRTVCNFRTNPSSELEFYEIPPKVAGELDDLSTGQLRTKRMKLDAKGDWIEFSLDGDLSSTYGYGLQGFHPIGSPIRTRLEEVKRLLAEGREVRIHSTRSDEQVTEWLKKNQVSGAVITKIGRSQMGIG